MSIFVCRNISAKVSDYVKAKYGEGLEPDEWLRYWNDVIGFALGEFFYQETQQELNEKKQSMSAHSLTLHLDELVRWYAKRDPENDEILPPDQQEAEVANAITILDRLKGSGQYA